MKGLCCEPTLQLVLKLAEIQSFRAFRKSVKPNTINTSLFKHTYTQKGKSILVAQPTVRYVHVLLITGVVGVMILASGERRNIYV